MSDRAERVLARVSYDHGCWAFTGTLDRHGYGRIGHHDGTGLAHRAVYESLVGPLADDIALDHLCRNRSCVNPQHLDPVPNAENIRRGARPNLAKTRCPHGHEYTAANTRIKPWGGRECRHCGNDATAARHRRRRSMQRSAE